jgi:hypothetical protein
MEKRAVEQARIQFDHASKALADLKGSNDFAAIERHWTEFLGAAGRVFNKLEQGAKVSGESRAWFGRKHGQRRSDPLLRYVWHARNVNEHSLEQVAELNPGHAKVVEPTKRDLAALAEWEKTETRPHAVLGLVEAVFSHVALKSVTDRAVPFPPPDTHLGAKVEHKTPAHVGDLELAYLAAMIAEAESLVV